MLNNRDINSSQWPLIMIKNYCYKVTLENWSAKFLGSKVIILLFLPTEKSSPPTHFFPYLTKQEKKRITYSHVNRVKFFSFPSLLSYPSPLFYPAPSNLNEPIKLFTFELQPGHANYHFLLAMRVLYLSILQYYCLIQKLIYMN